MKGKSMSKRFALIDPVATIPRLAAALMAISMLALPHTAAAQFAVPVHRFWSDLLATHFYTNSEREMQAVIATMPEWGYEGIGWHAFQQPVARTLPVHRFWSPVLGAHFYTINERERRTIVDTMPVWDYEGVAYYAYPEPTAGSRPIYRFWSPQLENHFYTANLRERDLVIENNPVFDYEGVAWYSPLPGGEPGSSAGQATWLNIPDLIYEGIAPAGDVDFYAFRVGSETNVILGSTGSTDTLAYLLDATGFTIASNDDGGASRNFEMQEQLTPGDYFLEVRHYSDVGTGDYGLYLRDEGAGQSVGSVVTLAIGQERTGTFYAADEEHWYVLQTPGRGILRIWIDADTTTSAYLYDVNSNRLSDERLRSNILISEGTLGPEALYLEIKPGHDMFFNPTLGSYVVYAEFFPLP